MKQHAVTLTAFRRGAATTLFSSPVKILEVKVKFSFCKPRRQAGGADIKLHSFLNSALNRAQDVRFLTLSLYIQNRHLLYSGEAMKFGAEKNLLRQSRIENPDVRAK
jgi:hypothetical protein